MLLWELTFQRIPYKDWQIATVQNHVLSGKREVINFGGEPSPIQQGFINLIEAGKLFIINQSFKLKYNY